MADVKALSDAGGRVFSVFLIGSGLYGILSTPNMGKLFGVRDVNEDRLTFYPGIAVRNLSAGLAAAVLMMNGQRKAVGILFACWLPVGLIDTKILLDYPRKDAVQNVWIHLFNIGLLGSTALGLLKSS